MHTGLLYAVLWMFLVEQMAHDNHLQKRTVLFIGPHVCSHFSNLQKSNNKAAVDSIFKELDTNQDNSVDFREFGRLVFSLTVMCHEHFTAKK